MLVAHHDITLGSYRIAGLISARIHRSSDTLSSVATLSLPAANLNAPYAIEGRVKRGDAVVIRLGYDGGLQEEFRGFVRAIYPDTPARIECEDALWLTRKLIRDKRFKKTDAVVVLRYVLAEINRQLPPNVPAITLKTDLSGMVLDGFSIVRATGYEVLEKLRELTHCALYMQWAAAGPVLHYHLTYTEKTGEAIYDFARNIRQQSDLEYIRKEDRKVLVKVVGKSRKGNVSVEVGEAGGDSVTIHRPTISDRATLERVGKELLKQRTYNGYKGVIRGWLYPFCDVGYSVTVRDRLYPARAGVYYCTAVTVEFGPKTGGRRTVALGLKLSGV